MNILFICDEFPPGKTGGIGIATSVLARSLASRGHKVLVAGLCVHGYGAPDHEVTVEGIEIFRLRYASDFGLISSKDHLLDKVLTHGLRNAGILAMDARAQFRKLMALVRHLISDHQVDVIEMPDWNNFFFNIRPVDFVIPALPVPLVVKMHGSYNYFRSLAGLPVKKHFLRLEEQLYERADALCAVSGFTADYGRRFYALSPSVQVLYNGVALGHYVPVSQRSRNNTVIFSGTLLPKKGILALAACWKYVVEKIPGATLKIYGKGDQAKVKSALDATVQNTVTFYGHVPREELITALSSADLAVFPSFSETFGMAAAEAMAVGCPVIFTRYTSGPEIITDGVDGWLADPHDIRQLAEVIVNALSDQETRSRISAAAYEKVKSHFEIGQVAASHEQFYEQVIRNFKSLLSGKIPD